MTHLGGISLRGEPSPEGAAGAGWAAVSGDQAELPGPRGGLGAVGGPELAQDVGHVLFHGVEGDHQLLGDARVRGARGQQRQDFQLAGGQLVNQAGHRRGGLPLRRHGACLTTGAQERGQVAGANATGWGSLVSLGGG